MPKIRQAHCHHCRFERQFRKHSIDHVSHLAATVFSFGLWSVGWLALTIYHLRKPWRCTFCGSRLRWDSTKPADEHQTKLRGFQYKPQTGGRLSEDLAP